MDVVRSCGALVRAIIACACGFADRALACGPAGARARRGSSGCWLPTERSCRWPSVCHVSCLRAPCSRVSRAGGCENAAGRTPAEDGDGDNDASDDNVQWHALGHAGAPRAVSDLIPRVRADWFDDRVALEKLQDRNPNRVGGAWPLGLVHDGVRRSPFVHASCGFAHTAAVTEDGCVWTWGAGQEGQLGHYNWESLRQPTRVHLSHAGPVAPPQESPKKDVSDVEIPAFSAPAPAEGAGLGGKKVTMVACGQAHSAAVTRDGGLWLWGRGHEGQLGLNHADRLNVPTLLSAQALGRSRVAMVACGACHTAVVTDSGGVWTWGLGEDGQLGHELRESSRLPVEVGPRRLGGLCALMVSCGHAHTGVVTEGGAIWMWGAGARGRLGLGDSERRFSPQLNKKHPTPPHLTPPQPVHCGRKCSRICCTPWMLGESRTWSRGR